MTSSRRAASPPCPPTCRSSCAAGWPAGPRPAPTGSRPRPATSRCRCRSPSSGCGSSTSSSPASAEYNSALALRLTGPLDVAALRRRAARAGRPGTSRCGPPSTTVDGAAVQVVHAGPDRATCRWSTCRPARDAGPAAVAGVRRPVRPAARPAVPGACWSGSADDEHVLLLTAHHIVTDGWSMGVLVDELAAAVRGRRSRPAEPTCPSCRCSTRTSPCGSASGSPGRRSTSTLDVLARPARRDRPAGAADRPAAPGGAHLGRRGARVRRARRRSPPAGRARPASTTPPCSPR